MKTQRLPGRASRCIATPLVLAIIAGCSSPEATSGGTVGSSAPVPPAELPEARPTGCDVAAFGTFDVLLPGASVATQLAGPLVSLRVGFEDGSWITLVSSTSHQDAPPDPAPTAIVTADGARSAMRGAQDLDGDVLLTMTWVEDDDPRVLASVQSLGVPESKVLDLVRTVRFVDADEFASYQRDLGLTPVC